MAEQQVKFPRRSVLFMPGDSLRKISKALHLDVDSIVMDLEDGVALNQKDAARRTVVEALETLEFGPRERLVRVNPVATGLFAADVEATINARPDGYVLPKVEAAEQIQEVSRTLATAERARGWQLGAIRLLPVIETARGIMNLKEISQSSRRLAALMFGAEDLAGDIGAVRTRAGQEVLFARSAVVTAAAAYKLQAIDMVFVDLNDVAGLEEEAAFARQLGYDGKMAIHPRQVKIINRAFAPSPQEIERARHLIRAYAEHQAAGAGAFELHGKMVDMPMVRAAQRVLAREQMSK